MTKVLIAGLGYVGQALARNLREAYQVSAIKRNKISYEGVQVYALDLSAENSFKVLPREFDALFYLVAAENSSEAGYQKAYLKSNQNLFHHLKDSLPKRSIFVSSTSVYHQDDGSSIDESSPTNPTHFRGQIMLEAEKFFRQSYSEVSVVRAAGIYGPGRTRLLDSVFQGKSDVSARVTNRIHRDDLAKLLLWLLEQPANKTPIVNAVDRMPVEKRTLVHDLAQMLGANFTYPVGSSTSKGKEVRSQLIQDLGFEFKYPSYKEGYAEIINEFLKSKA